MLRLGQYLYAFSSARPVLLSGPSIIEKSSVEKLFYFDFNATVYKSIILEEFDSAFIVQPTILKHLLKGCSYAHPVTCCPDIKGTFSRVYALSSDM